MSLMINILKDHFLLPAPFTIAILLTFLRGFGFFGLKHHINRDLNSLEKTIFILKAWNKGLWDVKGLAFAIQMMLMLLLGHVLAISKPIDKAINKLLPLCRSNAKSAFIVTFLTLLLSWFNWGLGLFGAIFCKKLIMLLIFNFN